MARRRIKISAGLITDIHYGLDVASKLGSKARRLMQAFEKAVAHYKPDFIVDMGDRVSAKSEASDRKHMESLQQHFNRMAAPVHHLTGNHDEYHLSRTEIERITGTTAASSWKDQEDFRFVFWNPKITNNGKGLFANPEDIAWLKDSLTDKAKKVLIFSHMPFDHVESEVPNPHGHISARFHYAESDHIRKILEEAGNVRLCLNGHVHRNHHAEINGIHYISQQSLTQTYQKKYRVPAAAWSWLEIDDDNIIVKLQGKVRKNYVVPIVA